MKHLTFCVAVLSISLLSAPSFANPISVSAGNSVMFNFDFPAALPLISPPYDTVTFTSDLVTPLNPPGSYGTWTFCTDINQGGICGNYPAETLTSTTFSTIGFTDGYFSASLSVTNGTLTVNPYAVGYIGSDQTDQIIPTIATNGQGTGSSNLPEPATASLFGLGLLSLVLTRSRRMVRT